MINIRNHTKFKHCSLIGIRRLVFKGLSGLKLFYGCFSFSNHHYLSIYRLSLSPSFQLCPHQAPFPASKMVRIWSQPVTHRKPSQKSTWTRVESMGSFLKLLQRIIIKIPIIVPISMKPSDKFCLVYGILQKKIRIFVSFGTYQFETLQRLFIIFYFSQFC